MLFGLTRYLRGSQAKHKCIRRVCSCSAQNSVHADTESVVRNHGPSRVEEKGEGTPHLGGEGGRHPWVSNPATEKRGPPSLAPESMNHPSNTTAVAVMISIIPLLRGSCTMVSTGTSEIPVPCRVRAAPQPKRLGAGKHIFAPAEACNYNILAPRKLPLLPLNTRSLGVLVRGRCVCCARWRTIICNRFAFPPSLAVGDLPWPSYHRSSERDEIEQVYLPGLPHSNMYAHVNVVSMGKAC